MKPLESYQQVLMWLCGSPPHASDSNQRKIAYIALTSMAITANLLSVISSTVFIYRNVSVNLEETLYSLFHNVGSMSSLYQDIATVLLSHKLIRIFENLALIYDQSKKMFIQNYYFIQWNVHSLRWKRRFVPPFEANKWEVRMDVANLQQICFAWLHNQYDLNDYTFSSLLLHYKRTIWYKEGVPSI